MIVPIVLFILSAVESPSFLKDAQTALQQGGYPSAIDLFQKEIDRHPDSYDARYGLARALSFSGKYSEAIKVFSELISDTPNDPDARLGRGRAYAWEKQYPEAIADLSWITEHFPDYADAWSALGDAYRWSDRPEEAIAAYTHWIELRPDEPAPYLNRAQVYQNAHRLKEAECDLRKALSLGGDATRINDMLEGLKPADPMDDPDVRLRRGLAFAREEKYAEAIADLSWITEHYPDYADAWSALGDAYRWSDRPEEAIAAYTHWIELRPDEPAPYLSRSRAFRNAGRLTDAKDDLYKAESLGGDSNLIDEVLKTLERADHHYPWQYGVLYDYLNFSPSPTEWHTVKSIIRRNFDHGSLGIESIGTERFSFWDDAVAVDGFLDLWPRAYANLRFQITSDADVLPRLDYMGDLYQGFGDGWELSSGYRHIDYSRNNVDLYNVALGKYLGDWYLRGRTYFLPENDGIDLSQSFLIRRYLWSEDDFIQFETGFGNESVTLGANQYVESRRTHFFSVGFQKYITPRFGLIASLIYQDIDQTPIRRGINFGFVTRW